jgi:hypothetical protein
LSEAKADLPTRRYRWYLAYIHFLDAAEINAASGYLDAFVTDWGSSNPQEYALETAYFCARKRKSSMRRGLGRHRNRRRRALGAAESAGGDRMGDE